MKQIYSSLCLHDTVNTMFAAWRPCASYQQGYKRGQWPCGEMVSPWRTNSISLDTQWLLTTGVLRSRSGCSLALAIAVPGAFHDFGKNHQGDLQSTSKVSWPERLIGFMLFLNKKEHVSVECISRQAEHSSNTLKETTPWTGLWGWGGSGGRVRSWGSGCQASLII